MSRKQCLVEQDTIGTPTYFSNFLLSDNSIINLQIYDTPGQEKYRALIESYYKRADGIILVYDISNKESFKECKNYFCENIKEKCKRDIKVILVGNKSDLEEKREVSFQEANDFASLNNYIHIQTSCLKNENVFEAFEKIIGI